MADYLDISLKDICAFGDDIKHIEMIEHCGCGVAMANALDIVKEKPTLLHYQMKINLHLPKSAG